MQHKKGQGIAILVHQGVQVLEVLKSTSFVTMALNVPKYGKSAISAIYIPPVQVGYNAKRYSQI